MMTGIVVDLEREADSEQHAEGGAKRVACHEELGVGI